MLSATLHDFLLLLERAGQCIVSLVLGQLQSLPASDHRLQRGRAKQPLLQLIGYELFLLKSGVYRCR